MCHGDVTGLVHGSAEGRAVGAMRGSNENTNGLLSQYFPRRTDFSRISQSYLNAIALRLNQRPRKTLGFETPADRLQGCCTDRLSAHPKLRHHSIRAKSTLRAKNRHLAVQQIFDYSITSSASNCIE